MKLFALAVCSFFLISIAKADDIPEGPGKKVVVRVCTACHDLGPIQSMNAKKDDWQSVVDDMTGKGAEGSEDDFKTIVTYLAKYYGPTINVNSATADSLKTELDLTGDEAAAIVKYRTDKGNFKVYADLSKVPGLDMTKLDPLKKRLTF